MGNFKTLSPAACDCSVLEKQQRALQDWYICSLCTPLGSDPANSKDVNLGLAIYLVLSGAACPSRTTTEKEHVFNKPPVVAHSVPKCTCLKKLLTNYQ